MISGFGSNSYYQHDVKARHAQDLPVPFNIPKVLHNLLFEEVELDFDRKQEDMVETLRFSFNSLIKIEKEYAIKEDELKSKMFQEPDNMEIKNEYQDIHLERQQINFDFKNLVVVMSDMLTREQLEKLLKFSNINI